MLVTSSKTWSGFLGSISRAGGGGGGGGDEHPQPFHMGVPPILGSTFLSKSSNTLQVLAFLAQPVLKIAG